MQIECASHNLHTEGCGGERCGAPDPWPGPHATVKQAVIEFIREGTVNGLASGKIHVNAAGVASEGTPACL